MVLAGTRVLLPQSLYPGLWLSCRAGIPFEGNYSSWLEAKQTRLAGEKREQASLSRSINSELEWVRSNAKGQQKKGKARMRRYEDLVNEVGASASLPSKRALPQFSSRAHMFVCAHMPG